MKSRIIALAFSVLALALPAFSQDAAAKETKSSGHGIQPTATSVAEVDKSKIDEAKYRVEKLNLGSSKNPRVQELLVDWSIFTDKDQKTSVQPTEGMAQRMLRVQRKTLNDAEAKANNRKAGACVEVSIAWFGKKELKESFERIDLLDEAKLGLKFQELPTRNGIPEYDALYSIKVFVDDTHWGVVNIGKLAVIYLEPLSDPEGDTAKDTKAAKNKSDAPVTLVARIWTPKPATDATSVEDKPANPPAEQPADDDRPAPKK